MSAATERARAAVRDARSLVRSSDAAEAGRAVVFPVLGALGFCSRVPLGTSDAAWRAFTRRPAAMVVAAYPLGAALALALLPAVAPALAPAALPGTPAIPAVPPATVALLLPAWLLALTGVAHLDGLADAADAAVVHGDVERRREVLYDAAVGVGGLAAGGVVLLGVALAGLGLAEFVIGATGASAARDAPWTALAAAGAVVLAVEVGAKLGVVLLASLGPRPFGTLSEQFAGAGRRTAAAAVALALPGVALPALAIGPAAGIAAGLAVLAGPLAAVAVGAWGRARLDGVNGDCYGATNEIARVLGLHAGLVALSTAAAAGSLAAPATTGSLPVMDAAGSIASPVLAEVVA